MELAYFMRLPLARVRAETTSGDFVLWKVFLEEKQDPNRPTPDQYYLAQIAMEMRRSYEKGVQSIDNHLIKWERKDEQKRPKTEAEKQSYLQRTKSFWMSLGKGKGK